MKRDKWIVLALLCGAYFFHQADRAIFGALLPYVKADLGLTDLQLGHVNTVLFLTIAVATFIAGFLGDRFSRKRIIVFSLIFWSVATMGLGFASSFVVVVLLRSVATGGGESFYGPSAMSLLAAYHQETRSLAFSIHQAALYLGLMLSGTLACWVLGWVGSWRGVFVVFGGCGLLLGLLFIPLLREPVRERASSNGQPIGQSLWAFFRNPSALLATTGFIAICCVNNTYVTWAPKMFHERFQVDGAVAGAHVMFYHHLVAFGAILAGGWLTDHLVRRLPRFRLGLQILALLLGAPAIGLIGQMNEFSAALAMTAAYGLFRGLFEVNTHASVFDVVPPAHRASVVGFMLLLAMGTSAFFSGELMGWLFDTKGAAAYETAFVLMGATYLIGALLMSFSFFFTFRRDRLANQLSEAAEVLNRGGVAVIPTDTVYGLAARPDCQAAVDRLYSIKGRELKKPIALLASDIAAIERLGFSLAGKARELAERHWPGALTLVVGKEGFRIPDHVGTRKLLAACGGVLRVTSANLSGQRPATDAPQALAEVGLSADYVVDDGISPGGVPSTVVRVNDDGSLTILREGAIRL